MSKKVRILSIDGGGIRGIIPATVMKYVEEELIRKTENPSARIADYFDMIVGTSTGGILGCFYLVPNPGGDGTAVPSVKHKASTALELYTKRGNEIFDQSKRSFHWIRKLFDAKKHRPDNLERIFSDFFGDLKHSELHKRCIITTYDLNSKRAFFFNSRENGKYKGKRDFYVRDVARSTSAGPTYFPPAEIVNLVDGTPMINIDGGVFANNPAMCAYAEARSTEFPESGVSYPGAKDMMILSVGTGSRPIDPGDVGKAGNWGLISWGKAAPEIMMDGAKDTVNYQVERIFSSLDDEYRKNFLRVDVPEKYRSGEPYLYNGDMNDASPENINNLKTAGQKALEQSLTLKAGEYRHTLDSFIDELIEIEDTPVVKGGD